jgi:hypothetical protein
MGHLLAGDTLAMDTIMGTIRNPNSILVASMDAANNTLVEFIGMVIVTPIIVAHTVEAL